MSLRINDTAPDFTANTTHGEIQFHDFIGDGYALLFSHPKDFTPVCTTELGYVGALQSKFAELNCKVLAISVDTVEDHLKWKDDIAQVQGTAIDYPLIADTDLSISKLYNMLPAGEGDSSQGRTAAHNATVRTVFLIGPDKKIKMMLAYPMTTGRNFDELIRVLKSIQLTAEHKVATPANWQEGDDVIVVPAVSTEDAEKQHGTVTTVLPYLRTVKQPKI